MQKLCIFMAMTLFSYLGWYVGSLIGGFMTAFFISGAFSLLGVWVGWRTHNRFFL